MQKVKIRTTKKLYSFDNVVRLQYSVKQQNSVTITQEIDGDRKHTELNNVMFIVSEV